MSAHSKEPLKAWRRKDAQDEPGAIDDSYIGALLNIHNRVVAKCAKTYQPRLLDCYNACAGMADPAKEIAALRECAAALRACESVFVAWIHDAGPYGDLNSGESAEKDAAVSMLETVRKALAKLPAK